MAQDFISRKIRNKKERVILMEDKEEFILTPEMEEELSNGKEEGEE